MVGLFLLPFLELNKIHFTILNKLIIVWKGTDDVETK